MAREVQSISDLHKLDNDTKPAFHDKKKHEEKEWSVSSTKSSSSEPTDEEIADLVQRQGIIKL